jgi:hypothetical protein
MKLKQWIFLGLGLIAAGLLAFPLRNMIQTTVILPLAKLIWLVKGYYKASSQAVYWIVALVVAGMIAVLSVRIPDWEDWRGRHEKKPLPGPVEELAFWLQKDRSGIFPKWYVARLLADLALNLLDRKSTERAERQLAGTGWNPPSEVQNYLEAALKTSYTEYQRTGRAGKQSPTPFDLNLEPVIEYLESMLENENDHHS